MFTRVIQFFYFNPPMPKQDSKHQTKYLLLKPFCIWLQIRSSPMILTFLSYYIKHDLFSNFKSSGNFEFETKCKMVLIKMLILMMGMMGILF